MEFEREYNPALLKLELLCQGIRPSQQVQELLGTVSKEPLRQRAGAGSSGIDLVLAGGIYAGVPRDELFCAGSPFTLEAVNGGIAIAKNGKPIQEVQLYPRPKYYDRISRSGVPMQRIGTVQGDFIGIAPDNRCWFWGHYEGNKLREARGKECKYCVIGLTMDATEQPWKTIDQMVEVCEEALKEKHCRHVSLNAGAFPPPGRGHEEYAEIVRAIKKQLNVFVKLSIAPPDEEKYVDILLDSGADFVGYNYEIFDPEKYRKICPGKYEEIDRGKPHSQYDRILQYAVRRAGWKNRIFSSFVGGLEPRESTVKGIEHVAAMGVVPRVFVFRALRGAGFEKHPMPRPEDMVFIYRHLKEITERYGVDTGCSGCSRIEVAAKRHHGINPAMPDITDTDLEYAGLNPALAG